VLEAALDKLVKAKGFEDCIVSVGTDNVNVIIKKGILSKDEVNMNLSTVTRKSGREARYAKNYSR
jgi:hypothetical protein